MPLLLSAGAIPGGTLSALFVLFVHLALLAPDGERSSEGQRVNSP